MIDVRAILYELGIDLKEGGKNVGSSDINIDCPFCGAEKHLGINVNSGLVNCWVCGFDDLQRWPSLAKVLVETTGERWDYIKEVMSEHGWEPFIYRVNKESDIASKAILPKEALPITKLMPFIKPGNDEAIQYLSSRMFSMDTVMKYNLHYAKNGHYGGRIVIPIYFNGTLSSFTSRSYRHEGRYKHAMLNMSSTRIKDLLYNYDSAKRFRKIYVLEGPTDVWRMGDNSVGIFKSELSRTQRRLLVSLSKNSLRELVIIFDYMAYSRAIKAAEDLCPFIEKIKVVRLDNKRDVADRTRENIYKLEKETGYFVG